MNPGWPLRDSNPDALLEPRILNGLGRDEATRDDAMGAEFSIDREPSESETPLVRAPRHPETPTTEARSWAQSLAVGRRSPVVAHALGLVVVELDAVGVAVAGETVCATRPAGQAAVGWLAHLVRVGWTPAPNHNRETDKHDDSEMFHGANDL
jgi:hypothetical protein